MQPCLIIPGWQGSGPGHWQSCWEHELSAARRLAVRSWDAPERADWVSALDAAIRAAPAPPVLVAHSLGCLAVAHWAAGGRRAVSGALLVAPPDLEREGSPHALRDFAPVPRARLAFPARLVASDDDPYASLAYARQLAGDWGAELRVLTRAGHINRDAGFGPWPQGRAWLSEIADRAGAAAASA